MIDINSDSVSIPVNSSGSRVEYTDVTFQNYSNVPYNSTGSAVNAVADALTYTYKTNELLLSAATNANFPLKWGSKGL